MFSRSMVCGIAAVLALSACTGESPMEPVDPIVVTDTVGVTDTLFVTDTVTITLTDTVIVIPPTDTTDVPDLTGINEYLESIDVTASSCDLDNCIHDVSIRPLDPLLRLKINVSVLPFLLAEHEVILETGVGYSTVWVWWDRPNYASMNNVDLKWYWHTTRPNQYLKVCVAEWVDYPARGAVTEENGVCAVVNSSDL